MAAAVVGLALLTVFAIELSNTQAKSKSDVEARVHERAVLAGALIDSLFQTVTQQVPQEVKIYGGAHVSAATMNAHRASNAYVALLNSSGTVLAASDGFTPQVLATIKTSGALALVQAGHPYGLGDLSEVGGQGVLDFAVGFPTPYGKRILVSGTPATGLATFLKADLLKIPVSWARTTTCSTATTACSRPTIRRIPPAAGS